MDSLDMNVKFKLISSNINSIPPYDGNRDALLNFVQRIDYMCPMLDTFTAQEYKILLIGQIKDKIIGNARISLLINGNPYTWPEVKRVLIDNHGEKNSVDELIDKIRICRCDSTIEAFYNSLNTLLCRLNNASIFFTNSTSSESNARIALNSFKHGLPEPVKSIIVSRNPKTLKDAYDIIKSNGHLNYKNQQIFFFNSSSLNRSSNLEHDADNMNFATQQHRQQHSYNRGPNKNQYLNQQNSQLFNNSNISNRANDAFSQQHRQQYNNNSNNNNHRQPSFNSSNSNQTNRTNRSSGSFLNQNNSNKRLFNNRKYNNVEPMEIGVNENEQNFQLQGPENNPI